MNSSKCEKHLKRFWELSKTADRLKLLKEYASINVFNHESLTLRRDVIG